MQINTDISEPEKVILENASGPMKVTSDAGSVEQHSLDELIQTEKYLASKETTKGNGLGTKLSKIEPDGTT